jgi:hypothetical protein
MDDQQEGSTVALTDLNTACSRIPAYMYYNSWALSLVVDDTKDDMDALVFTILYSNRLKMELESVALLLF